MQKFISIVGASEHNLKKISVTIPRNKLVVFTGVSGSGKSSLAFNTIYAEGQRRYVESLSTYARQFLGRLDKPAVDSIDGLSPAIAIEQKTIGRNPRSTVGTITEIYDYYRLLYARIGTPYDPDTGKELSKQTIDQIVDTVMEFSTGTKLTVLAPVVRNKKGTHKKILDDARQLGFSRVRVDGSMSLLEDVGALSKTYKHSIDIVTGRIVVKADAIKRITEAFEKALELAGGNAIALLEGTDEADATERNFSLHFAYENSELSVPEFEPQLFSFNSPIGSCSQCAGLGYTMEFDEQLVVPDMDKSYVERGIAPIPESWNWYAAQIRALAKLFGESVEKPFSAWSKKAMDALLYGTSEAISYTLQNESGSRNYTKKFPGVLGDLLRRYHTTKDPRFRDYLEGFMSTNTCSACAGGRLRKEALAVRVNKKNIHELTQLSVAKSIAFFDTLSLREKEQTIAVEILREIQARLSFLQEVGLGYLSLDRYAGTLSGGESQRIRLASHIGSALVGVMYVLDEPTIGLHQRDNDRLILTLQRLRDLGNTVIVVEHDEQVIRCADYVLDIGPHAGKHGGEIVGKGTPASIAKNKKTLTGKYLANELHMKIPSERRAGNGKFLRVKGASEHNLKNVGVEFPLGTFAAVTGVSGSGKSSLLQDILYPAVHNALHSSKMSCGSFKALEGVEHLDKIIDINQSPIGRTPRSNPGTYVKVFDHIRDLYYQLPESRARGYTKGRFSFNVSGGRCEACQGAGTQTIEMHFLSDVYVTCDVCRGKRFNRETLDIYYKGKNIHDVLSMTVDEAADFFKAIPAVFRRLQVLQEVGMGYITLGQSAVTLSGGEAQRIKLALELSKVSTGRTLYILDEPTTGLHQADVLKLLHVLHELVQRGNTVIVIEHNLEVIAQSDYIVDLGPEGGDGGGQVIAAGTPEGVMKTKGSFTATYLAQYVREHGHS